MSPQPSTLQTALCVHLQRVAYKTNTPVPSWMVFRDDFGRDIGVEAALGAIWLCFLVFDLLEFSRVFSSYFRWIYMHLRASEVG